MYSAEVKWNISKARWIWELGTRYEGCTTSRSMSWYVICILVRQRHLLDGVRSVKSQWRYICRYNRLRIYGWCGCIGCLNYLKCATLLHFTHRINKIAIAMTFSVWLKSSTNFIILASGGRLSTATKKAW